ncbi:MAG TPA: CoA transferase, partial [Arenibaculum sp.]|nr:CoA transferase [Arenibaculum sp.]
LVALGAEVVKVEPPSGDPLRRLGEPDTGGLTAFYKLVNSGKTVVRLDLKSEEGGQVLAGLLARADVLVESYRPGTLERLGFGPTRMAGLNPGLVHVALSGWGQSGPYRLRAGHDLNYMAVGGGLSLSGTREAPTVAFPPTADHASALQAAVAVCAALFDRTRTGRGAYLDVSLMETVLGWQANTLTEAERGRPQERGCGMLSGGTAWYRVYRTADGRFMAIGAVEEKFWDAFCQAVGRPEWSARHADPLPQNDLIGEVAAMFARRPQADWAALLADIDCCVEPVLDPAEVPDHPQVRARGQVRRHDGLVEVLFGLHADGRPPAARRPVQELAPAQVLAAWRHRAEDTEG